jgi:hypothetical protein
MLLAAGKGTPNAGTAPVPPTSLSARDCPAEAAMPVEYGKDRRGSYIEKITFSTPPTPEERAALVAFGAERREAVRKNHLSATNRANAKHLAQTRREQKAARDAALLEDVQPLRAKHLKWSSRQIARSLLLNDLRYKTETTLTVAALARRIDRALKASTPNNK